MEQLGGAVFPIVLVIFAIALLIAIPVTICALLFTALRRVPERYRQMEPALVWLLVIPCFSFVWNFFVFPRLSRSLSSAYRAGGRTEVGDCGYGIGLAYAICMAVSFVPYVGFVTYAAGLVLVVLYLVKVLALSRQIPAPIAGEEPLAEFAAAKKSSAPFIAAIVGGAILGLIVIGGIVASIAIPNLLNAIDRGKQKRTMADLRSVATAIESYRVDAGNLPIATDLEALEGKIAPNYILVMPKVDGWGRPIFVDIRDDEYTLLSTGKDGVADGCEPGATQSFDSDICFANGRFVRYPEGQQR